MKGANKFYKLLSNTSLAIYPWKCRLCGSINEDESAVCRHCEKYLPWCSQSQVCGQCGLSISISESECNICGTCQNHPPHFDELQSSFWYQAPIDSFITGYKYFNAWNHAQTLVKLSSSQLGKLAKSALVIPMPSHPARIRERGFNAVYELIKCYRKHIDMNVDTNNIQRVKYTHTQTGMLKAQRRKNVRGAFTVTKEIKHDHVLIFDEVVTTTATVNELSRCLKKHGVKKVSVFSIARTK